MKITAETTDEETEFIKIAKVAEKAKEFFYKQLKTEYNLEGAYYPIQLIVWLTNDDFEPIKKLVEIDEREGGAEG